MYNILLEKRRKCNVELVKRSWSVWAATSVTILELSAGCVLITEVVYFIASYQFSCFLSTQRTFATHRSSVNTVFSCGLHLAFLSVQTSFAELITLQGSTLVIDWLWTHDHYSYLILRCSLLTSVDFCTTTFHRSATVVFGFPALLASANWPKKYFITMPELDKHGRLGGFLDIEEFEDGWRRRFVLLDESTLKFFKGKDTMQVYIRHRYAKVCLLKGKTKFQSETTTYGY